MKLFLMTLPTFFVEEHRILSALFDEGLEQLHIRKPDSEPVYSERLLSLLPKEYLSRVVVHDHFYLRDEYNLKGVHLNSRNVTLEKSMRGYVGCTVRTAEDLKKFQKTFSYIFFSPAFSGESPANISEQLLLARDASLIGKKVFAAGGITEKNIQQIRDLGFGAAVILGDLWNRFNLHADTDYREMINHFRRLRKLAD